MKFLFPYMARWKALNWSRYHQIFSSLASMGHDIYVLQPPSANSKETNFREIECDIPANIHLIDLKINQLIWNINLPFSKLLKKGYYSICCKNVIDRLVVEYDIDILFLYNIPQYFLLKHSLCFTIFDFADDYIDMLRYELGRFSSHLTIQFAEKILFDMIKTSNLTTVVSHTLADYLRNKLPDAPIIIVPNGINLAEFSLPVKEDNKENSDKKKTVVGFIGSFEYFIDFDLILDIAQRLPAIEFLLVGTGREFESVKNKAQHRKLNNVIFTGGIPHSEIMQYIAKMDICLNIFKKIPVSHAACPIKLYEYLIMKKPVISNTLQEIKRIDERFIFFSDTVDEFVDTINNIRAKKILTSQCINKGYNTVCEKYSWDKITKRFLDTIENYLSK